MTGKTREMAAECESVAELLDKAAGLYGQWRHGIWESVDEMRAVRTDLPERVFRLVADLIAVDEATR